MIDEFTNHTCGDSCVGQSAFPRGRLPQALAAARAAGPVERRTRAKWRRARARAQRVTGGS